MENISYYKDRGLFIVYKTETFEFIDIYNTEKRILEKYPNAKCVDKQTLN